MSFGQAASRPEGFVTVRPADPCPCGSGATFDGCCAPVLAGTPAATAERLMRSRYSAFVVGDERHLVETWLPRTRPEAIHLDPALRWRGLEIIEATAGGPGDARGTVEFRARWRDGGTSGALHECSRFVRYAGRWWYVDGDTG